MRHSCPPSRLSINSKNIIIESKQLANNIDKVFEKSRHISTIKSRIYNNTNTASMSLRSLFLKNQINFLEWNLTEGLIENIQKSDSIIAIGQELPKKIEGIDR